MTPWWERIPGRLEYELEALKCAGIAAVVDERARERGVIALRLTMPEGTPLTRNLLAEFPDTYPYTRPEVYAPDLSLPKHQNPFGKNVCLLGRATENWRTTDCLAGVLRTQLPLLAESLATTGGTADVEERQGEPFSTYLRYEEGSLVFIDSSWRLPPRVRHGTMSLLSLDDQVLRAVVRSIHAADGTQLAAGPFQPAAGEPRRALWVRLDAPVRDSSPHAWFTAFKSAHPNWALQMKKHSDLIGFVFPEQLDADTTGDGWVFIALEQEKRLAPRLIRAARCGSADLAARLPLFTRALRLRIAVFGAGCVGAPSILEFAKSGVGELRFLDHDIVEAGTAVRWPFGLERAGWSKAVALADFIEQNYPWVKILSMQHRVGSPAQDLRDGYVLEQMLQGVHLVYDATAETGIQHLLSDLARERGLPYVCISGTPGGAGGVVARIGADAGSGCWTCLQRAMAQETIVLPAVTDELRVQPQGCADPTFTGANYDFMEVVLQGVRLGMATLLGFERPQDEYAWDVAVLRLRDDLGRRIVPEWTVYSLPKSPDCPNCKPE
jgi:hypothetical protein